MKSLLDIFIFFLLTITQTTLVFMGEIEGAKADLLFAYLIYYSLYRRRQVGMIVGFFSGLFIDLYEPQFLGLNALINTSIGFLIGSIAERLYRERILSQFLTLL